MKLLKTRKISGVRKGVGNLSASLRGGFAVFCAAVCAMTMANTLLADETVGVDTQLAAAGTVSGTLYLADGATLDISERTEGISVDSPALTFEDDATIAIRLGGNNVRNPLVSWTTPPANLGTLTFVKADGASGYSLKVKDNGLYAARGFVITVR